MTTKWQDLFTTIEIIEKIENGQEIPDKIELEKFEAELGIVLPVEYKGFCTIFGTGVFTSELRIYCPPDPDFSDIALGTMRNDLNRYPSSNQSKFMSVDDIRTLIDSALVFGDTSMSDIFFWDLRTYNEFDKSYDIYWADDAYKGNIRYLGRNFFDFVQDYGAGTKFLDIIPQKIQFPSDRPKPTFTRFKARRGDINQLESPTDEEEFMTQIALMVKVALASGLSAERISESYGISLETVRQAIDKANDIYNFDFPITDQLSP